MRIRRSVGLRVLDCRARAKEKDPESCVVLGKFSNLWELILPKWGRSPALFVSCGYSEDQTRQQMSRAT